MKLSEIDKHHITNDVIEQVLFCTPQFEFKKADCLIIFGCHIKTLLDERIDCALEISKKKKIEFFLLTGGIGLKGDFNEAQYMKERLLVSGIAANKILIEDKSKTTEENITNSIKILKQKRILKNKTIVVVSNQAHLRRIGMELKKHLISNCCNIIYKYPKNELVSFENMKKKEKVRNMLINQVIKIVDYVNEGKLQDEDIKWSSVK